MTMMWTYFFVGWVCSLVVTILIGCLLIWWVNQFPQEGDYPDCIVDICRSVDGYTEYKGVKIYCGGFFD